MAGPAAIAPGAGKPGSALRGQVELVQQSSEDTCGTYPHLKFLGMLHNNLGGKGPDPAPEGIVYLVRYLGAASGSLYGTEQELVLSAVGNYTPFAAKLNGFSGQFGCINVE